jgi:hypothetical protein
MFSVLLGALIRAPSTGQKQNGNGYIWYEITGVCEHKHNEYTCPASVSAALFVLRVELYQQRRSPDLLVSGVVDFEVCALTTAGFCT